MSKPETTKKPDPKRPFKDFPKPPIMLRPDSTDAQFQWAADVISGRIDPATPMPPD